MTDSRGLHNNADRSTEGCLKQTQSTYTGGRSEKTVKQTSTPCLVLRYSVVSDSL